MTVRLRICRTEEIGPTHRRFCGFEIEAQKRFLFWRFWVPLWHLDSEGWFKPVRFDTLERATAALRHLTSDPAVTIRFSGRVITKCERAPVAGSVR